MHLASVIAIILTNSIFSFGVSYHIRYTKSNTVPMMIIPPTTKIESLPLVAFFGYLLIVEVMSVMGKLNKNELEIFQ